MSRMMLGIICGLVFGAIGDGGNSHIELLAE